MINENEYMTEAYLKKIVEQNDAIIGLLKVIADNVKPTKTEDEENRIVLDKMESLTKRERQILELIMQGMMNKQMAYELQLSLSTIEAHRSGLMKKMDVKNLTQLTKEYMKYQSLMKF